MCVFGFQIIKLKGMKKGEKLKRRSAPEEGPPENPRYVTRSYVRTGGRRAAGMLTEGLNGRKEEKKEAAEDHK